jgi:type I restriction enzyme S subunit
MGNNRPYIQLHAICEHSAFGPRFSSDEYAADGNVACLRTMDIDSNGRINFQAMPIAKLDLIRLKNHILQRDDIVITRTGAYLGKVAVFSEFRLPVLPGAFSIRFRLKQDIVNPLFLRYYFNGAEGQRSIQSIATGSAQPNINITNLHSLEIPLPPLPEQKAIAHILGTLDDKIELNRRMNATLEGIAQRLFKSWFVDFDPVIDNALAAGNPIPDELADRAEVRRQALADGTANREAAKPFPAAFQQTESMGWIPEGWEVRPLDQVADFKNGLALQKFRPKSDETPLPIVKIAQLKTGEATWDELASPSITPDCIIDDGDVVFSWSGSLMIDIWCGGRAALNQHLFKVTSNDFPKWFYFKWSDEHLHSFQRIAADKAVTMGHIKRSHLSKAFCAVPCKKLIEMGTTQFDPFLEKIVRTRLHSRSLTKLRDTLLPKLISGEIRIPEADQLIERISS